MANATVNQKTEEKKKLHLKSEKITVHCTLKMLHDCIVRRIFLVIIRIKSLKKLK